MPNVIQIRDKEGNALYPITDSSLVIGLKDGGIMENVMAWDGTSAPTVANIPAGVQVEYNSTTYTGTLAASGTTSGYIYLVASATQQGEYDRYIVNAAGGSYTWVALSSTQIVSPTIADNLTTNDATKALSAKQGVVLEGEISQLGQEVDGLIRDNLDADFSVSDEDGMAIVQFKNGEINTKNFDSATTPKEDTTENGDLEISDGNGNVLARFYDGHIKTKKFDSADHPDACISALNKYKGKRVSILGDSISTFGTPSATNEDGTYCYSYYPAASCRYSEDGVDSIQFNVNNTYWMRIISMTGMVLGINDSYRGTMVSGTTNAFNLQTRIDHLGENGTPDVILVYGGTNDAGGNVTIGTFNTENPQNYTDEQIASLPVTTFADAYRTMLIRLMKKYPLAEIVVILPTFTTSYYTITNLDLYVEVIKEACDFFGIKYIDTRVSGINIYNKSNYLVDGIHPNVGGMQLLANKIYKQLIFV